MSPEPFSCQLAAAAPAPAPVLTTRLPVLRRPSGWRMLDESALRARATQIYLSLLPQSPWIHGGGPGPAPAVAHGARPARPPSPAVALVPAQRALGEFDDMAAEEAEQRGRRLRAGEGARGAGAQVRIHAGWLLAALLLVGCLLAAMLLTTLEVRKLNPAAVANAMRAAQQDRRDGPGGAPGIALPAQGPPGEPAVAPEGSRDVSPDGARTDAGAGPATGAAGAPFLRGSPP